MDEPESIMPQAELNKIGRRIDAQTDILARAIRILLEGRELSDEWSCLKLEAFVRRGANGATHIDDIRFALKPPTPQQPPELDPAAQH